MAHNLSFIQIFLLIGGFACIGWASSRLATSRGRDSTTWFFLGMFFGLSGLIVLYFLPSLVKKEETVKLIVTPTPVVIEATPEWFFVDRMRNQHGPVEFGVLKSKWKDKTIDPLTYVWKADMDSWKKIEELPDIHQQLK